MARAWFFCGVIRPDNTTEEDYVAGRSIVLLSGLTRDHDDHEGAGLRCRFA
jgi:hypothetical protein